jgi:hypothetical protein
MPWVRGVGGPTSFETASVPQSKGKSNTWISERTAHEPTGDMINRYDRGAQTPGDLQYVPLPDIARAIPGIDGPVGRAVKTQVATEVLGIGPDWQMGTWTDRLSADANLPHAARRRLAALHAAFYSPAPA